MVVTPPGLFHILRVYFVAGNYKKQSVKGENEL